MLVVDREALPVVIFSSVKLTITLLVLIVLLFIAGTFIPPHDVVENICQAAFTGSS